MPAKGVGLDRCDGAPAWVRRPSSSGLAQRWNEEPMKAVLVASGEPVPGDERWLDAADLVVAVDAGATWLRAAGRMPDALVGDMDSVDPGLVDALEADGVAIERHPAAKDSSDTELALAFARGRGADELVVIGAFGGPRLDHAIANILLLATDHEGSLSLVRGGGRVTALRGGAAVDFASPAGSVVSLFPLGGDATGVTTSGLRYPLNDEALRMGSSRGLSNVIETQPARVELREGTLLVVEQAAEGD
jgi:thiamine pyrophosphokinase